MNAAYGCNKELRDASSTVCELDNTPRTSTKGWHKNRGGPDELTEQKSL